MLRMIAVAAALAILSLTAPASAQFAYVSATGNDANTCWLEASPCKTLQRGINQTATGGELRVLSQIISSGYISKSMTIDAEGHAIIGSFIVDSASAIVAFRRIVLTGRGIYPTGFDIRNAAAVHIEDSTAERYTGLGIKLVGSTFATRLFVSNTVSRDNGGSGLSVVNNHAFVTIDNSRFERNNDYGMILAAKGSNISRSVASGNVIGIYLLGGTANITETTATDNGGGAS